MIIYKAQNKINGKIYIGQTRKDLSERIKRHLIGDSYFQKSLRKHGLECFNFSVIDEAETKDILNEKEKYWIKFFNSKSPNGYNLTDGGEGVNGRKGFHISDHQKSILREANRRRQGCCLSEDHKRKLSEANKGFKHSEVTKRKLSELLTGRVFSKESKQRMSEAHSEEICKKAWNTRRGISCL